MLHISPSVCPSEPHGIVIAITFVLIRHVIWVKRVPNGMGAVDPNIVLEGSIWYTISGVANNPLLPFLCERLILSLLLTCARSRHGDF